MITFTNSGLYCAAGDFYIDPWKPVTRAVITHAHSDHARFGSRYYLCEHATVPLLKIRLGQDINVQGISYYESIYFNGVKVSLHPAGHIIGSAQIRIEKDGEVWVVSGDYKLENDGLSAPFEPVKCHTFITESTFGLPIYRWAPQDQLFAGIGQWIDDNRQLAKASVLLAYSLGKAQRVMQHLQHKTEKFLVHGAIANTQEALVQSGWKLPPIEHITPETPKSAFPNSIIIAPPSADVSWMKKFSPYALGICSGWMTVRGNMRRQNADAGFALSDHADWPGLLSAVKATGAQKVYVTHGFSSVFARYLNEQGIPAEEVVTAYGEEENGNIVNN
ncbi:ligase-associated DNA damage response exonuclease [Chitinophaga sp. CB10]|uniref:ligase-associated DNA damage response exonuclease n=1 Tax=Chitinophaga sp. CB10 TaxID=1891659 RepID=UPI000A825BB4|nr:ligase-associated DNA damage response exonuclease [Chitinophaga sp. CB10]